MLFMLSGVVRGFNQKSKTVFPWIEFTFYIFVTSFKHSKYITLYLWNQKSLLKAIHLIFLLKLNIIVLKIYENQHYFLIIKIKNHS